MSPSPVHVAITGASSGIGEALALEWARRGAKVTAVARRMNLLEALAAKGEGRIRPVQADLGRVAACADWIAPAEAAHGPIDVLVNNAGMVIVARTAEKPWADVETLLHLNLHTPLRLIQAVLPGMLARRSGTIVNVASVAALVAPPGQQFYGASKAGLAAASESIRAELRGSGVHVLTVYPGPVHTAMEKEALAGFEGKPAFMPAGEPDELARLVIRAVERRSARVIYPRFYALSRWLPPFARWVTDRLAPKVRGA